MRSEYPPLLPICTSSSPPRPRCLWTHGKPYWLLTRYSRESSRDSSPEMRETISAHLPRRRTISAHHIAPPTTCCFKCNDKLSDRFFCSLPTPHSTIWEPWRNPLFIDGSLGRGWGAWTPRARQWCWQGCAKGPGMPEPFANIEIDTLGRIFSFIRFDGYPPGWGPDRDQNCHFVRMVCKEWRETFDALYKPYRC